MILSHNEILVHQLSNRLRSDVTAAAALFETTGRLDLC